MCAGVGQVEVSSTKHHPVPGQAGVTGGEAQARLPDPVLPLRGGAEQGGVPRASPVRHVHWPGPDATFAILNQLKDFLITLAHEVGGGYTGAYKKFCGVQTVESIVLIPQNFLYAPVNCNILQCLIIEY